MVRAKGIYRAKQPRKVHLVEPNPNNRSITIAITESKFRVPNFNESAKAALTRSLEALDKQRQS